MLNRTLLHKDIQDYINANLSADTASLLLKGVHFENATSKEIIEQIESKRRCKFKLPTWYNTNGIYYPNKLNIEQTSSEITANYKAYLVSGKTLIDLTGGFGVDTYFFSKKFETVIHCEINSLLSEIAEDNTKKLRANNIKCLNESGIDALKRMDKTFDWIYIDPSRRDDTKKKVFLLSDCTPNVKTFQDLFLKYAPHIMIKTSPLLDIKATKSHLKHAKEVHIVAVNNEVKELLWILKRNYLGDFMVKTINFSNSGTQQLNLNFEEERALKANYTLPLTYLYEPNSAILKAGAFNTVSNKLDVPKLHKHSHLYTSNELIDFPGRRFLVQTVIPFNKKSFAKEKIQKANVSTRNFPLSVGDIRRKLKIKDGGPLYLFFTTSINNKKIILVCRKA